MSPGTPLFRISNLEPLFFSPGPTRQPPFLSSSMFCLAAARTRCHAAEQPRDTRRPSSAVVPRASSARPYPPRRRRGLILHDPLSPTLALPHSPLPPPELPRRRRFIISGRSLLDSSCGELPLTLLLRFPSSLGPFLRRAGAPAELAAYRRRAASSSPLLARAAAGELRRRSLHPVRAPFAPLWLRLPVPLAVAARDACARTA